MPMADNRVGGSFYVNSTALGAWEDVIVTELVRFIDDRFRTEPRRERRILAGQSMGGFGALYLAGRHPDTFAHVYAMSPCCLGFVGDLAPESDLWRADPRPWFKAMVHALAPGPASTTAQPTVPLPFVVGAGGRIEENRPVAEAWRRLLSLERLKADAARNRRLCTIGLEAGRQDEIPNVTAGAAAFDRELSRAGIVHTYTEFTGGHIDRTRERFESVVLPFFARVFGRAVRNATHGRCGR